MSNTIVHRDSISRIVTSHWPCLARCRPFCNIEFHRYACQSPTTAITNHGGYGLFRSASSWILREANLWFTRAMFPVRYNSRLPYPRECESVQESTTLRLRLHPGNAVYEENAWRDLNFKCGSTRATLISLGADYTF